MRTDRKDTMFKLKSNEPSDLSDEIDRLLIEMNELEIDTEEYKLRLDYLERLSTVKTSYCRRPISSDALIGAASNLLIVGVLVGYEQKHVITSKVIGMIKLFR